MRVADRRSPNPEPSNEPTAGPRKKNPRLNFAHLSLSDRKMRIYQKSKQIDVPYFFLPNFYSHILRVCECPTNGRQSLSTSNVRVLTESPLPFAILALWRCNFLLYVIREQTLGYRPQSWHLDSGLWSCWKSRSSPKLHACVAQHTWMRLFSKRSSIDYFISHS